MSGCRPLIVCANSPRWRQRYSTVPVSRALQRLLRVLDLEEEQKRAALQSAQAELTRMEHSKRAAAERERLGRKLIAAGMLSGELPETLAGMAESNAGARHQASLKSRIAAQKIEISTRRDAFLTKRVERQQLETLIHQAKSEEARVAGRREQQSLDVGYLNRIREKDR